MYDLFSKDDSDFDIAWKEYLFWFEKLKNVIERFGYDSPQANMAGQVVAEAGKYLEKLKKEY